MSKRSFPSSLESNTETPPLKKKQASLFSIATVHEENDRDKDDNSLNASFHSDHSIGLDLMAREEGPNAGAASAPVTVVFQPSTRKNEVLRSSPPPLSSTEDSSCGDEDSQDSLSRPGTKQPSSSPPQEIQATQSYRKLEAKLRNTVSDQTDTISEAAVTSGPASSNAQGDFRTGLVFEAGSSHFDRHSRFHKERPLRVTSIMDALKKSQNDAWDRCRILGEDESTVSATTMPTQSATNFLDDEDYLRVHLPGYMKRLDKLFDCNCCKEERLDREAEQYKSIYFTKDSLSEAKRAASSLCSLVENVVQGDLDNGFAVIRPPGHHAEPGLAGGYCVINNVAVAAAYAREKLGIQRILICDWDVHHGNGTQSIFLKDKDTLYFSAHRWHGGNFFPFLSNGGPTNVGMGDGVGRNINVGWTVKGVGDEEYLALWETLLLPVAKEFQPELILVSAGFDAAQGDLGECNITPEGYASLTRSLMTLNAPMVCALEGGYVRSILGKCVSSVVSALLDRCSARKSILEAEEDSRERGEDEVLNTINATAAKNIKATIAAHKPYWKCLV